MLFQLSPSCIQNESTLIWVCLPKQEGAVVATDLNDEATQGASSVHIGDTIGGQFAGEDQLYRHGGVRGHDGG